MRDRTRDLIRVLESVGEIRRTTNPYLAMLIQALQSRDDVSVQMFGFRRAILGRYDIFHVHWPEVIFGGHRRIGRLVRRSLTSLLLARLALTRTPVVRTWHNTERPSGLSRWDHLLLDAFDRQTRVRIRLNDVTELPDDVPVITVRHGHYRDWYASHPRSAPVPQRIGYIGLIRRYKGVEDLLAAFRGIGDPAASLHVSGRASSEHLQTAIAELAAGDDRISLRFGFVDDDDLVREMTESALIALPYVHMHNSGTMLTALSLGRPVLVPNNAVNRSLRDEFGPAWVHLYEETLTPDALKQALHTVSTAPPTPSPPWDGREWDGAANKHVEAFRLAVGR